MDGLVSVVYWRATAFGHPDEKQVSMYVGRQALSSSSK